MERGFFSTALKQKQRKQKPNFTLKERLKDSWHSYFRVSCSTLLILQELPMENMEQKAVLPSRRVAVTEQASMSSRNQSAKEHQGLFRVTLGMCVQDADLWDLMASRRASHHGIHTSETETAAFAIPSCLSHKDGDTAERNPGQRLEGTNTAIESLADAKGGVSSEALLNHTPKSLLIMGRETLLLTKKSKRSSRKQPGQTFSQCKTSLLQLDLSQHFTH